MKMPGRNEIERLYDEHAQPLFAFLLNFTRDEADTRDLLQEIFVKLAREPKLLDDVREERAFLIRLAHNAAIDLMRRRSTRERTKENFAAEMISIFAPANDPDGKVFREELEIALGELPEEQRAVVHLKLWGELTFEEIADCVGNSAEHGGEPLSLRFRQIAPAAASTSRRNQMNDEFEQKLSRQPPQKIPGEWRGEILSAARAAVSRPSTLDPRRNWLSTLNHQLSTFSGRTPKRGRGWRRSGFLFSR